MKYNLKTLFMVALFIISFSFVVAQVSQSLGTFKQGTCVNLIQTCDNCSYINISQVLNPDSSVVPINIDMTKVGTDFNYTFCGTQKIGKYIVTGFDDLNGNMQSWIYDFIIDPVGSNENNTTTFLILILSSAALLIIAFIFENHVFSFLAGLDFLVTGVYTLIYGFGSITNTYTQAAAMVIIGMGAIVTIVSALEFLEDMSGGDSQGESYDTYED